MENIVHIIWAAVIVLTVSVFGSCTAYVNNKDNRAIVELVQAGANPLQATCAIKGVNSGTPCLVTTLVKP